MKKSNVNIASLMAVAAFLSVTGCNQENLAQTKDVPVKQEKTGNFREPPAFPDDLTWGQMPPPDQGKPGVMTQKITSWKASKIYKKDSSENGKSYNSIGKDENAVLVCKGTTNVITKGRLVRKSEKSTGGDRSGFFGVSAAALVTNGSLTVSNSEIETKANGGTGVFAYDKGVAFVSGTTIKTHKNASGGIHVAGGGYLEAENLTVETEGDSSAAIRSDRGGGQMIVSGGSFTSSGNGSPAVYCTADIWVSGANLEAKNSEGICIEGKNSLYLENCHLISNMPEQEVNDCTWSVILYQSMSGDSEIGKSLFTMENGLLESRNGGIFYTTNSRSSINLKNVEIHADHPDFLIRCTGNGNKRGWGEVGNNGAVCDFNASSQILEGNIVYDSISYLDVTLSKGSVFTGAVVDDESAVNITGKGGCNLTLERECQWIVTGDSVVSTLVNKGNIFDEDGNTVSIAYPDGKIIKNGESGYTITVKANYFE